MTIRLGIAGLGTAGAAMLGAAFGHGGVTVTAVADTDIESLRVDGPGAPRQYDSFDGLLGDDGVDAIYIATPTPAHYNQVLRALEAGRHVVVEKPVTATRAEAAELAARATAFDRIVIVGHSEAFEPYVQAVSRAIADGLIGPPVMVMSEKHTDWMRRPRLPAEWDAAAGGGLIRRQGVHQVDVLRSVLGPGAGLTVRQAGTRPDPERGVPGSYFAWLDRGDGQSAFIAHDGIGRLSLSEAQAGHAAGDRADGEDAGEDAAKRARRHALARRVLRDRTAIRLGKADSERLLVVGRDGEIVASSPRAEVLSSAGPRPLDLAAFPEGRHAVLDELVAAVAGTRDVVHDLAWGCESLRVCEDIERVAQESGPLR
jgi:phthalate 4,5-cis-dihydrodiol dehydrogenase